MKSTTVAIIILSALAFTSCHKNSQTKAETQPITPSSDEHRVVDNIAPETKHTEDTESLSDSDIYKNNLMAMECMKKCEDCESHCQMSYSQCIAICKDGDEDCTAKCEQNVDTCNAQCIPDKENANDSNNDNCVDHCPEWIETSPCADVVADELQEPPEFHDESPRPFRFTVRTCKAGEYIIPLVQPDEYDIKLSDNADSQYQVNYDLDCDGDGVYEKTHQAGDVVCDLSEGVHHIAIRGTIPGIKFNTGEYCRNAQDLLTNLNVRVVSIDQWGDNAWRNLWKMFDCKPADILVGTTYGAIKDPPSQWNGFRRYYNAKDTPDLTYIRKLSCVGGGYTDYRGSFADWDVSNITDMSRMFESLTVYDVCISCPTLTGDFDQDISRWNTSNVVDMSGMFIGSSIFNQPIGKWDTSKVTDMSKMFMNASSFNQPIEKWNTSKVTDMSRMFMYAFDFDQPVEKLNISSVKDMSDMFDEANSFSHYPSSWVVPKGHISGMFEGTKVYELSEKKPLKTR